MVSISALSDRIAQRKGVGVNVGAIVVSISALSDRIAQRRRLAQHSIDINVSISALSDRIAQPQVLKKSARGKMTWQRFCWA